MNNAHTNSDSPKARIEASGLRVEFDGATGPTRLIVPVILQVGTHKDLSLRIWPRSDVALHNEVDVGDAFSTTFTNSHANTVGGSFFATASHSRAIGRSHRPYDVVHLEDLRGVRFRLFRIDVEEEPIAIQLAFRISACGNVAQENYFAEIVLEVNGDEIQRERLPREVHPAAGKVLLLSGYSEASEQQHSLGLHGFRLSGIRRSFLTISTLHRPTLMELRTLATGYDGVHFYTHVGRGELRLNDSEISADVFFEQLNGLGLKFIFLATCDSVQVVRSFRATDIHALIAATENLYEGYANEFEWLLYNSLGTGDFISTAFRKTSSALCGWGARRGSYDPMFLDSKSDFRFGSHGSTA